MLLYIDAHCVDDEFKALIFKDYEVTVIDDKDQWRMIFKGSKENLELMYKDHWDEDFEIGSGELDNCLKEEI